MINGRPKVVKLGFSLGLLGGLLSFVAAIYAYDGTADSVIYVGICMLTMVLFFMLGGGFTPNGIGSWGLLTGVAAITAGICVASIFYGNVNIWLGSVMTVIALLIMLSAACSETGRWIEIDKLTR